MKKVFILDTNILLNNPLSIYQFDDNDVVIPISVIEEIDNFKKDMSDIGRNAREVSRMMDKMRNHGNLSSGIPIFEDRKDSGMLFVYLGQNMDILPELLASNTDNHILAIGLTLQNQFGDKRKVSIITKDTNLRIKADAFGLAAEDFEADKVDISDFYTGHRTITAATSEINTLYAERELKLEGEDLKANEFVILEENGNPEQYVYGMYDKEADVVRLTENRVEGGFGEFIQEMLSKQWLLTLFLMTLFVLLRLAVKQVLVRHFMAIAAGLQKTTDEDIYQKLLVSRPVFPLGRDIGYLPGDLDEKLNPWMQPIFDNIELLLGGGVGGRQKRLSKSYQELINQGILAVEPLTYIRGRSIPNQFFIVDEAQNLTAHEVKTILTRAGEGTKIILTGDPYQIDNPYIDSQNNGLTYVIERFKDQPIAAHVTSE